VIGQHSTVCLHNKPMISDPRSWYMQLHAEIRWPVNFKTNARTANYLPVEQPTANPYGPLFMSFRSHNRKQHRSAFVFIVCHFVDVTTVRSDVCHGSTISSADFLRKLNHAHKSWPTLSIVWLLLKRTGSSVQFSSFLPVSARLYDSQPNNRRHSQHSD